MHISRHGVYRLLLNTVTKEYIKDIKAVSNCIGKQVLLERSKVFHLENLRYSLERFIFRTHCY